MDFPRQTARRSKTKSAKIELPSLLATISAKQATTPTARIQAKAATAAQGARADASDTDVISPAKGDSHDKNSPSFNRLAANLLTGRTRL